MRLLLSVLLFISFAAAQDWQTITTMNDVRAVVRVDDALWAATSGGVFRYNETDHSIQTFTNINGIQSLILADIEADNHEQIITGGESGLLEIYNEQTMSWRQLYALQGNAIHDIFYSDDSLWVAAGKGVAIFIWNGNEYLFKDFYQNFPLLPGKTSSVLTLNGILWLATDSGLLRAPADIGRFTINDPAQWSVYGIADGLPSLNVTALERQGSRLFIGTSKGLASWTKESEIHQAMNWYKDINGNYMYVSHIRDAGSSLFITSSGYVFKYIPESGTSFLKDLKNAITGLALDADFKYILGLNNAGLYIEGMSKPLQLSGPRSNVFSRVLIDDAGGYWGLSYPPSSISAKGFYVNKGKRWENYLYYGSDWFTLNAAFTIIQDRFNNILIGTWGGGLIFIPPSGIPEYFHNFSSAGTLQYQTADTTENIPLDDAIVHSGFLAGVANNHKYEVISALKEGPDQRLWIGNYWASNDHLLASAPYTSEGTLSLNKDDWVYFGKNDGIVATEGSVSSIAFDDFGRVWIGTYKDGVFVLDYNHTLKDKSDDKMYRINTDDDLYSNTIYSLASDQDGIIWIGTGAGLNSYDGVNVYKHVGDPEGLTGPLENRINDIFVDEYNNKWFATSGGLSILKAGYSAWDSHAWKGYSTKNSALVSDNVFSVFVDSKSARALVGTDRGLSVYSGTFAEVESDFSKIAGGPNPFEVTANGGLYTLTHLQNHSTVKIFTLNGALVRQLDTRTFYSDGSAALEGSRAYWDGKDSSGRVVNSGIYLYAAYTLEGQSVSGKIAVIRK